MEGGKSVFASFFGWPEDRKFGEKVYFRASYSMSNKLLVVARNILTTGLENVFKVGSVKFANSLSPPSICEEIFLRTRSKISHRT